MLSKYFTSKEALITVIVGREGKIRNSRKIVIVIPLN